ncbi:hypothetical protein [Persicitalea jodogahamensis]|uniref:DUF975 family protein n=1 Tax=Persicitalea jodogahamensis TaxID=402147 RepID=A0A8J3G9Z9_9BACT|nr:hypothetical protein [Persicitalea jodogahamensis]GHB67497.1 hypothetical protein GCM10007390_21010 [Persicitalea jodogahamensis]
MEKIPLLIPPTVNSSLSFGWEKMKQYFLPLLLVVLVIAVVNIPLDSMRDTLKDSSETLLRKDELLLQILSAAYWLLLLPAFEYSADLMFIHAIRDQKLDFNNLFAGFRNYLNVVLAHLLVAALVGIAFIALIIPGIFVACRLAFVSYLVIDKGLEPIEAVETSWNMTRKHGWKIFGLACMSILIGLGGLLLLIVGLIPAIIWIKASFASLYEAILIENEAE